MRKALRAVFLVALFGLAAMFAGAGRAEAAAKATFVPCHGTSGVFCATVPVPLDRSGLLAGQIPLAVEKLPATGMSRGTMLLLAGGPGQSSTRAFDLASFGRKLRLRFPGYDLVTYDDRGTGDSGFIDCSVDSSITTFDAFVTECANRIGPGLELYASRDHALDADAVREAVGVDRIAVYGGSYGTKHALAFALAAPQHIERLLLDSVLPADAPDPLHTVELSSVAGAYDSLCVPGLCRNVTKDPGGDVVRLSNKLQAKPLILRLGRDRFRLDGEAYLSLVLAGDLDSAAAALVPSITRAALDGRPQPLIRLFRLFLLSSPEGELGPDLAFSEGLFFATTCNDGLFPWAPGTPTNQRQTALDAAVNALTPDDLSGFGRWATVMGTAGLCTSWPGATGIPVAPGPLPDVPVLTLGGDRDTRTPVIWAQQVAAQFPQGRVLIAPGVGHIVSGSSKCADNAIRTWLSGGTPPARCGRVKPDIAPIDAYSRSLRSIGPRSITQARRTLLGVHSNLGQLAPTIYESLGQIIPGLFGGSIRPRFENGAFDFVFKKFSDTPGLVLNGRLRIVGRYPPGTPFVGSLRVSGAQATSGVVDVLGPSVTYAKARKGR